MPYEKLSEIRARLDEVAPNLTKYGDVEDANYFKQAQELAAVSEITGNLMPASMGMLCIPALSITF